MTTKRILALLVMLSVCVFIAQGVNHSHADGSDDRHCQVCHIGHAAIPKPAAQSLSTSQFPVVRLALFNTLPPSVEPIFTQQIPRAPPV
ncbi:MAG: hypothetical protein WA823_12150 [Candidatus Acidiferrales bacterium]